MSFWRHRLTTLLRSQKRLRTKSTTAITHSAFEESLLPKDRPVRKPDGVKWSSPSTWILAAIPVLGFGLGTWQVYRLRWKVALIDEIEEKLSREPLVLPNRINTDALPDFLFRRVGLTGTWDHAHSMLVGPKTRDNVVGYNLVTPLRRSNGSTILVDRGFISREFAARESRNEDSGDVRLLGFLGVSMSKNAFTPDNDPVNGVWHWSDPIAMKEYAGGDAASVQPVLVEQTFDGDAAIASRMLAHGIPIGRPPEVTLRNMHATYAATWYSLSLATSGMFLYLLRKGRGTTGRAFG